MPRCGCLEIHPPYKQAIFAYLALDDVNPEKTLCLHVPHSAFAELCSSLPSRRHGIHRDDRDRLRHRSEWQKPKTKGQPSYMSVTGPLTCQYLLLSFLNQTSSQTLLAASFDFRTQIARFGGKREHSTTHPTISSTGDTKKRPSSNCVCGSEGRTI